MIPGRPNDRYGSGFYGLLESGDLSDQPVLGRALHDEWGLEVFYNFALTPWFQISPSLQYVDAGARGSGEPIVLATRVQIYF